MTSKVIIMITTNILNIPFHIISSDIIRSSILKFMTDSFHPKAVGSITTADYFNIVVNRFKIIPPANTEAI